MYATIRFSSSAAIGSVMIPAMEKKGYAKDFAAALIACAGTIGTMIPPSIPMIIYGVATGTSIGAPLARQLFQA